MLLNVFLTIHIVFQQITNEHYAEFFLNNIDVQKPLFERKQEKTFLFKRKRTKRCTLRCFSPYID